MISVEQISEILAVYQKHGWNLRRVLLSDGLRVQINEHTQDLFGGAQIVSSPELNAVWFSRASRRDAEAWEIRHLSETPFAMVEVFDSSISEEEREEKLAETEKLLKEKTSKNKV